MKNSQKPPVGVSWQRKQKGQFFYPISNDPMFQIFFQGKQCNSFQLIKLLVLLTYLCEMRSSFLNVIVVIVVLMSHQQLRSYGDGATA